MRNIPFRSASTISPVISTLSSFCARAVPPSLPSVKHPGGARTARRRNTHALDQVDVRRLPAPFSLLSLVLDLRAFVERAIARPLDRAEVDEQILAAFVGRDEPIALVSVEPLDSSGCHISFHLLANSLNGQERCKTGTIQLAQIAGRSVAPQATKGANRLPAE